MENDASNLVATQKATEILPIVQAIGRSDGAHATLEKLVTELESRLRPVLRMAPNEPMDSVGSALSAETPASDVAQSIHHHANVANQVSERIRQLLDRLEV